MGSLRSKSDRETSNHPLRLDVLRKWGLGYELFFCKRAKTQVELGLFWASSVGRRSGYGGIGSKASSELLRIAGKQTLTSDGLSKLPDAATIRKMAGNDC